MKPVFVDTSAFFAWVNLGDEHRVEAIAAFGQVHASGRRLLTTNSVVVETYSLIPCATR